MREAGRQLLEELRVEVAQRVGHDRVLVVRHPERLDQPLEVLLRLGEWPEQLAHDFVDEGAAWDLVPAGRDAGTFALDQSIDHGANERVAVAEVMADEASPNPHPLRERTERRAGESLVAHQDLERVEDLGRALDRFAGPPHDYRRGLPPGGPKRWPHASSRSLDATRSFAMATSSWVCTRIGWVVPIGSVRP